MPAGCHYKAVKRGYRYLGQTKDWGLIYWRQETHIDLPEGTHERISLKKDNQLGMYVDATHATDLKYRQSIGGQVALFTGTAIAYSAKWQIIVATSSTEAEFVQAVSATKMAKYLCTVLNELGITQQGPTMI
eukprot:13302068-Ditylum_brightwellii.AAC.1